MLPPLHRENQSSYTFIMIAVFYPMSSAGENLIHIVRLLDVLYMQRLSIYTALYIALYHLPLRFLCFPYSQLLCNDSVVNYLSMNFITWAWDVTFQEHRIK